MWSNFQDYVCMYVIQTIAIIEIEILNSRKNKQNVKDFNYLPNPLHLFVFIYKFINYLLGN